MKIASVDRQATRLTVTELSSGRHSIVARSSAVRGGDVGLGSPVFSPDGRLVAVANTHRRTDGRDVTSVIVARAAGEHARPVPGLRLLDVDDPDLAWTPDAKSIAIAQSSGQGVDLVDVQTGAHRALLRGPVDRLAFAPNGRTYAFDTGESIWTGDTNSGTVKRIIVGGSAPTWSSDSGHIAFLSTRDRNGSYTVHEGATQIANEVYVATDDGGHQRRMTHTTSDESGPLIWTNHDRALLYSRFAPTGGRSLVLDLVRRCSQPAPLKPANLPPDGDMSRWDYNGTSPELELTC